MARAELNRKDLAEKAEMPYSTVYTAYVRSTCSPAIAGRLAKALGVDVAEIVDNEKEQTQ